MLERGLRQARLLTTRVVPQTVARWMHDYRTTASPRCGKRERVWPQAALE